MHAEKLLAIKEAVRGKLEKRLQNYRSRLRSAMNLSIRGSEKGKRRSRKQIVSAKTSRRYKEYKNKRIWYEDEGQKRSIDRKF